MLCNNTCRTVGTTHRIYTHSLRRNAIMPLTIGPNGTFQHGLTERIFNK